MDQSTKFGLEQS